jgi:hypothetical protein
MAGGGGAGSQNVAHPFAFQYKESQRKKQIPFLATIQGGGLWPVLAVFATAVLVKGELADGTAPFSRQALNSDDK